MATIVENRIRIKLQKGLGLEFLHILNESHNHNVPENSETHFKLIVVAREFDGLSRIARQRKVMDILAEELSGPVHALSQRCYSPKEWEKVDPDTIPSSPNCRGGSGL